MAFIVQGFGSDQRIQLGAEEILRPMSWGTSWTKIRIGMRLACNTQNNFSICQFSVGVCEGNKGFTDPATTDAIVTVPAQALSTIWTGTWTWFAAGYVLMNTSGATSMRKVGTAITHSAAVNTNGVYMAAQPLMGAARSIYFIDITKQGGGALRFDQYGCGSASASLDHSRSFYLYQLENETPVMAGGSAASNRNGTFTASSSQQLWDTVCISWSRSVPVLELCDITVLRFF